MTAILYRDTRYGEKDRWVYGDPNDANMKMPQDHKECLGFIVSKKIVDKREIENYEGTAFFISIPAGKPGSRWFYLVTAKHVLFDEDGKRISNLWLRLNTLVGGREDILLNGTWVFNDNDDIDVAVMSIVPPDRNHFAWKHCQYSPLGTDRGEDRDNVFADETAIEEWGIGLGDELRVVGLFSKRTGNKRNIPIVRSGIISAMPEEPIEAEITKYKKTVKVKFNAYLAELRSIGGLSGSPVFVAVEYFRQPRKEGEARPLILGVAYRLFLLGMIRGHWHYEKQTSFITSAANKVKDVEQVNMGMALVTPIQDVLDVLYDEQGDLMKFRKAVEKTLAKQEPVEITEDSARRSGDEELTQTAFENALQRASRKVSEPSESESKRFQTSE